MNKYGDRITTRGISGQLKKLAVRYGIDPVVVYPHSFRHRFAKSFLERCNDIAFLADLMGHESIETTRIYLRKTSTEQRTIVDQVVDCKIRGIHAVAVVYASIYIVAILFVACSIRLIICSCSDKGGIGTRILEMESKRKLFLIPC